MVENTIRYTLSSHCKKAEFEDKLIEQIKIAHTLEIELQYNYI